MKSIFAIIVLIILNMNLYAQNERRVNEAKGLIPGAKAPLFKAIDRSGIEFSLENALKKSPVVLIFYRGFWCPVCNKHLAQIQDSLQLIHDKGAIVIAVSPEKPEYLDKMAEKSGASFTLLYDENYKISDAYDVTFKPETKQLFVYNTILGAHLKETHSDESQRLPIPSTYIINQDGIIIWRQFDPDYNNRSSISEIVKILSEKF